MARIVVSAWGSFGGGHPVLRVADVLRPRGHEPVVFASVSPT